ncbi:hypothetical protein TCAL_15486 [Tigriopus californicus]|uniref:Uncharacterized protein n=1 Tax=Tigriopus californicus TaxID=6832 RepID=A0A553PT70_TIGCA|nr:hypothetical protein TCAL_15486 [Tigriopus californicus]
MSTPIPVWNPLMLAHQANPYDRQDETQTQRRFMPVNLKYTVVVLLSSILVDHTYAKKSNFFGKSPTQVDIAQNAT